MFECHYEIQLPDSSHELYLVRIQKNGNNVDIVFDHAINKSAISQYSFVRPKKDVVYSLHMLLDFQEIIPACAVRFYVITQYSQLFANAICLVNIDDVPQASHAQVFFSGCEYVEDIKLLEGKIIVPQIIISPYKITCSSVSLGRASLQDSSAMMEKSAWEMSK